jgi:hypothetical protein
MRRGSILLALAIVALAVRPTRAIVYVAADFRTLVTEARAILLGRVVALQPEWTEGRRNIETHVSIDVERYMKGSLGPSVVVRLPGGQMGPYLSVMPGAPTFSEGDEVVLLLAGGGSEVPHILGLGQGVFRVLSDPSTGARTVVPELLLATGDTARIVRGDLTRRPSTLGQFEADVRAILAPPPQRGRR